MENKIQFKIKECPFCKSPLEFGYISAQGYPIVWGKEVGILHSVKDREILSGIFQGLDHIPSLRCTSCRIVIGQYA